MLTHMKFHNKIALIRTFASVSNESSPILVTYVLVTTGEIYAKMFLPVGPKTVKRKKKRRKNTKKGYFKAFYVLRKRNN